MAVVPLYQFHIVWNRPCDVRPDWTGSGVSARLIGMTGKGFGERLRPAALGGRALAPKIPEIPPYPSGRHPATCRQRCPLAGRTPPGPVRARPDRRSDRSSGWSRRRGVPRVAETAGAGALDAGLPDLARRRPGPGGAGPPHRGRPADTVRQDHASKAHPRRGRRPPRQCRQLAVRRPACSDHRGAADLRR